MHTVNTIYLIHHSHTDVGYTSDQPVVWDLQERFLDEALRLVEKYAASPVPFRWTVESTAVLERWLEHAPQTQIENLVKFEKAGLVEVTGMLGNLTPLYDADQLVESVQAIGRLRRQYGFQIRHAMNCDVNGEGWPLVDVLLDAGLRSFSMAVNSAVGGFPFKRRPYPFWWQGPSGRKILAHLGFPYDKGWTFGIGRDAQDFAENWWPTLDRHLSAINYPLSSMLIQSFHPFGDNGSAFEGFVEYIERWNQAGGFPRLVLATPSLWVDAVAAELERLPVHAGDWTDYWNFGCGSSAREQRINRASRDRLRSADALHATVSAVTGAGPSLARSMRRYRAEAWWNLNLWDEHTWGCDISIWAPHCDDTASQWGHKAELAYRARSLSLLLQRDGLAELARLVRRQDNEDVLIFNPLPWDRHIGGLVFNHALTPRGTADDATAGRHFADHDTTYDPLGETLPDESAPAPFRLLAPRLVPGYGYAVVPRAELLDPLSVTRAHHNPVLENRRFRVTLDMQSGGIASWYDKQLEHEWVDSAGKYGFHRFLHERVAGGDHPSPRDLVCKLDWTHTGVEIQTGWKKDWPAQRCQPERVLAFKVYETPLGQLAVQHLEAPGCQGLLRQSVFLPAEGDFIEVESAWEMSASTDPEAVYLPFQIHLSQPTVRLDLGGQAMQPGVDQLPGSCADYYTVQRWVDFHDGSKGLTIATPDVPMLMLGGFHLGDEALAFHLDEPLLLSWAANTYWMTNFRAHQPGQVRARYRLQPYAGAFDELRCHRFGAEAAQAQPLAQSLGEGCLTARFQPVGQLLRFGEGSVLPLHIKQAASGDGLLVRFYNPTDQEQPAVIAGAQLVIERAFLCDSFENPLVELPVANGAVHAKLAPRRMAFVKVEVQG